MTLRLLPNGWALRVAPDDPDPRDFPRVECACVARPLRCRPCRAACDFGVPHLITLSKEKTP